MGIIYVKQSANRFGKNRIKVYTDRMITLNP